LHSSKSASDDRAGRAYRKRLVGADEAERVKAARAWTRWENCTSYLTPPEGGESDGCLWPLVAWAPFLPCSALIAPTVSSAAAAPASTFANAAVGPNQRCRVTRTSSPLRSRGSRTTSSSTAASSIGRPGCSTMSIEFDTSRRSSSRVRTMVLFVWRHLIVIDCCDRCPVQAATMWCARPSPHGTCTVRCPKPPSRSWATRATAPTSPAREVGTTPLQVA